MENLQLLQGPDATRFLEERDLEVYPYVLNKPGLYLILGIAGVLYLFSAWVWFGNHATTLVWQIGLVAALVVATIFSIMVTYYNHVGANRLVALGKEVLVVGEREKFWAIDWDLLDLEKLGLKSMELNRGSGSLEIRVGGQHIRLLLYSPFALLADPQDFMFKLLSRFQDADIPEEE